jgi:hypothetical protein
MSKVEDPVNAFIGSNAFVTAKYSDPSDHRREELTHIIHDGDYPFDGLFLQFGVYMGVTAKYICDVLPPGETLWGFDSFEGLPVDWDMGQKYISKERFKLKEIPQFPDNMTVVPGFFDDSLDGWIEWINNTSKKNISFLDIDSDVYDSAKVVLEKLNHMIVPGTIIRFDEMVDWRLISDGNGSMGVLDMPRTVYTNWRDHEYKALLEWLSAYNRKIVPFSRDCYQSATYKVIL